MKRWTRTVFRTWYALTVCLFSVFLLAGCGSEAPSAGEGESGEESSGLAEELNVFNWSEYLPQSVIEKFEQKYGVKVNYSTYSSNEEMLAKLTAGGGIYDLAVASDYFIQPMVKEGLIQEIDLNNIPNFEET
ncbi:hypothetical protein BSNK01_27420 [Bacillaceae bacterium]